MGIIFLTMLKVLKRSDIAREGTVSDIDFGDWLLSQNVITEEAYFEKQNQAKTLLENF